MIKFLTENQQYLEKIGVLVVVIGFLVAANIAGRIYYNIDKKKEKFDFKRLITGVIKAFMVVLIVVALTVAYLVFSYLKILTSEMVNPLIICQSTAIMYFIKVSNTLIKIFGVKIKQEDPISTNTPTIETKEELPQNPNKEAIQNLINEIKGVI